MAECSEKIVIANSHESNAEIMKSIVEQEGCNAAHFGFMNFSEIKDIIEEEKPVLAVVEVPPFEDDINEANALFKENKDILFLVSTTDLGLVKTKLETFPNVKLIPEPFEIDAFSELVMQEINEIREGKITREREH
jgi:hypothetical protein